MTDEKISLELCCPNLSSVVVAQKAGIKRIELCSALSAGGLTPSYGMIMQAQKVFNGEIMVMVRPREGDFFYSDEEFNAMKADILFCKTQNIRISGFVFGILTREGKIDCIRTKELVDLSKPLKVCFHRAIDMSVNYLTNAVEEIIACGCDRILSSGAAVTAFDGIDSLAFLNEKYGDKIEIMAGSGINSENIEEIFKRTHISQFHFTAKKLQKNSMLFRKENVSMGNNFSVSEYDIYIADEAEINAIKKVSLSL
ncbi:MAG: copper homeostasis protein CutC [Bacteroidales bacterium]|jgi:copper homeostasis protein|nr:copper homeostasis protein CutC [Bacteroidales bacterium]